jgi:branched-chain amino acid transport system permease protein
LITTIWDGLALGAVYAIVAVTYNIPLVATGIFNFAQAEIIMLGMFGSYVMMSEWRWPVLPSVLACAAIGALVGLAEERLAVRPVNRDRSLGALVTTLGTGVALEGAAYVVFGSNTRDLAFFGGSNGMTLLGGRIVPVYLALVGTAVLLVGISIAIMRFSSFGLAARACISDRDAAAVRGINVNAVSSWSFALAGAVGAATGCLVGPVTGVFYNVGDTLVVFGFMVLALGGIGSFAGILIGAAAIGIVQAETERYLSSGYPLLVLYGILLTVLLLRPGGLIGNRTSRTI